MFGPLKVITLCNSKKLGFHYPDVIMTTIASSQITSLTVVYSTVNSDANQRKHQSSASLAFVWGINRDRWIHRTKGQLLCVCVCICLVHQVAHPFLGSNAHLLIFHCFHYFSYISCHYFRASVSSCVKYSSYSRWLIVSFVVLHSLSMCLCVSSSSWHKRHILFSYLSP